MFLCLIYFNIQKLKWQLWSKLFSFLIEIIIIYKYALTVR